MKQKMIGQQWQCRVAPSLGDGFAGTPKEVWNATDYKNDADPTVFFGLYGLPDFYVLWRHKGRKAILWCGSDIQHFLNGYWLDEEGEMRIKAFDLAPWIATYCENYVENEVEQNALASVGITSKVVPSFLGDVKKYDLAFKPGNRVYTSVSGDDFKLYGWDKIGLLAMMNPHIEFHLYGNKRDWIPSVSNALPNVRVHGRVTQEQMDKETREMQGALRLTEFDGFSEIVAKSLLWGQYPISIIRNPWTMPVESLGTIPALDKPNIEGRKWLLKNVNKYPWAK